MGYDAQEGGIILEVGVTITVPWEIYNIYAESAAALGDHTVQQVMAQVLCSYAECVRKGLAEEKVTGKDDPLS